jgi:solute carrier family 35 protein F5
MSVAADAAWALGVFFIVLVAAFWAGSSVLTQYIFDNLSFNEPFVLTYIGTSLFMIFLPGWLALSQFKCVNNPPFRRDPSVQVVTECCDSSYELVELMASASEDTGNDAFPSGDILMDIAEMDNAVMSPLQRLEESMVKSSGSRQNKKVGQIVSGSAPQSTTQHPGLMSHLGTARVSLIVCPIWFIANW